MPRGRKKVVESSTSVNNDASIIVSVMKESGVLKRILNRHHISCVDKEDLESDLYLEWLENPDGLIRAQQGGYLVQYATNSVRNKISVMRRNREFCVGDVVLDTIQEDEND